MEKVGLPIVVMEVINPDIDLGKWIYNFGLVNPYVEQILKDPTNSDLCKKVRQQSIHLVQIANKSLSLCERNTWRMVIHEGFKFEGMSEIHNVIHQAYNNWGHGGVELTHKELSDIYI